MNLSFIVVPTLIKILLINSVERIIHTNGAAGNFFFKKVYSVKKKFGQESAKDNNHV